jgi:hypothetical protein
MTMAHSKGGFWVGSDGLQTNLRVNRWMCECCGECEVDEKIIHKFDKLQRFLGTELNIHGACRCIVHNKEVGGSDTSRHLSICDAIDFSGPLPVDVLFFASIKMGFSGIGVYMDINKKGKNIPFLHVDLKTTRYTNPRFWYRTRNNKYHYYADEYNCFQKYTTHFKKELQNV